MANFPSLWARGSLTSGTSVVLAPVGLGRGPKRSSCVSAPGIYRPGLEESHHLNTWGMVKNFSYTQSIIQRSFAEYFLNLSVFFLIFLIFILTGRSSGLLGTSSWPVPRSSFNSVWSVRQSQRSAHAPSAGNASIQPTISYFNTWFTDVVWDGDWLGQKGRGFKSVTVEGAFRCHIQGKILGIIKQFENYRWGLSFNANLVLSRLPV